MNLIPVMWTRISETATFDTADYDVHGGTATVGGVLQNWENILGNASSFDTGFIVLEHDLYQQTVDVAIDYVLPDALARGNIKFSNVVECLHKPLEDSYLETNNNATNPPGNAATTLALTTSTVSGGGSSGTKGSSTGSGGASQTSGGSGQASPSTTGGAGFRTADLKMGPAGVAGALALGLVGGAMAVL